MVLQQGRLLLLSVTYAVALICLMLLAVALICLVLLAVAFLSPGVEVVVAGYMRIFYNVPINVHSKTVPAQRSCYK